MGKGGWEGKRSLSEAKKKFHEKGTKEELYHLERKGSLATFLRLGEILAFRDVSGATFFNSDPLKWELIEEVDKLKSCQPFLSELQEERSSQSPRQLHNETLDC